jgi:Mor family transcriptional regulator
MSDFGRELRRIIRAAGARHEIADERLDLLARSAWGMLRDRFGTRCVYIPAPDKTARDAAIVAAWHQGQTLAAIAGEHRLTSARIRQILTAEGALK